MEIALDLCVDIVTRRQQGSDCDVGVSEVSLEKVLMKLDRARNRSTNLYDGKECNMNDVCRNVKASIEESIFRAITQRRQDRIDEHIKRCAACREYLNTMRREDRDLVDFARSIEPSIERIEREVMRIFEEGVSRKSQKPKPI